MRGAHQISRVVDATAAGTGDVDGTGVSTAGFDAITFLFLLGVMGGVGECRIENSSDDGSSDAYATLDGSEVAVGATDDDKVVAITLQAPLLLWARPSIGRTGTNGVDGVIAILHGADEQPVSIAGLHSWTTVTAPSEA